MRLSTHSRGWILAKHRWPRCDSTVAQRRGTQIDRGEVKVSFDPRHEYLHAVLDALRVPASPAASDSTDKKQGFISI